MMQEVPNWMEGRPLGAMNTGPAPGRGVYAISVAAELVGMGSQTLRLYERRGLIEPARSGGGTRRYSSEDLERLRRIARLVDTGLNLAGVSMVLDLEDANAQLQADLDASRQRDQDRPALSGTNERPRSRAPRDQRRVTTSPETTKEP